MTLRERLKINGYSYYTSSSTELKNKVVEETITINGQRALTERGFELRQLEYTVICISESELHTLSGSFTKETVSVTTPQGESLVCFFETFGPWERSP